MITTNTQNQRMLQLSLYSGIALIVISMLFLGRGQDSSSSFWIQAVSVLAAPAFFYVVGTLVYRYLHAPLAAPGIIATGAWLIGVGLIHLYDKRMLMPEVLQPYYWLVASLLAGVLITLTGHRVRIWMLVPLVPLVQVNAVWAIMGVVGIPVEWMPPISFLLVLAWWEAPVKDERWRSVYHASAAVLTLFLLLFTIWLPLATAQTRMMTWGTGAMLVMMLGLRHGWVRLGPLAIIMLTCASVWGLPASWWPPVWLILAAGTIIFIERLAVRHEKGKGPKAVEISDALAVVLSGAAALFAQIAPMVDVPMHPLGTAGVLAGAGILLVWLGARRSLLASTHGGLWLIAAAWGSLYFVTVPTSGTFGLWLALFATGALLAERSLNPLRKEKRKESHTFTGTITHWPLADLIMGLSAIIIIWTAINISAASPWILAVTLCIVVGVWIAAGLIYRLPILLHAALWVAPLPYALLLILANPTLWTLPLLGSAWQALGAGFLVFAHSVPRYRPAVLAPFFIVGYALLGFGLTLAMANPVLLPISLGIVVIACLATSVAVISDHHPAWNVFVAWLIPPEKRAFAHKSLRHLFLFLGAWLSAIWINLMLGYTGMSLPRQGIFLVVLACAWFAIGRLLARLPGVVGWPVIGAGWLMWLIGLLEVFFSPTEAIITVIIGLALSGEILRRSQAVYWIPVFIVQGFFTVLQITWLLALPGRTVLLLAAISVSIGGMIYERYAHKAGRVTAITGGALALGIWLVLPDINSLPALVVLALLAAILYRQWRWLWVVYLGIAVFVLRSNAHVEWQGLLLVGLIQLVIGAELIRVLRPRRYRTFSRAFSKEQDWATPFLWAGILCITGALVMALRLTFNDLIQAALFTTAVSVMVTIRWRIPRLPRLPLLMTGVVLITISVRITNTLPFPVIGNSLIAISTGMILLAIVMRSLCTHTITHPYLLVHARWLVWWLRPFLTAAYVLSSVSLVMLLSIGSLYPANPVIKIANGLLLAAFAALVYSHKRQLAWLGALVALLWYSWALTLGALGIMGMIWQTLPIGVLLLILAKIGAHPQHASLELAGILVLLVGSVWNFDRTQLMSSAAIGVVLHLLGLTIYGYVAGRRIPFISAILMLLGGLVYAIFKVNVWLIPLMGGLLLVIGTLAVEVYREATEHWLGGWVSRWQTWK